MRRITMRILRLAMTVGVLLARPVLSSAAEADAARPAAQVLYSCDFQQAAVGAVPEDLMVLDGAFVVAAEGDQKFLELPGTPLDQFGVLFGPAAITNVTVQARAYGTNKGRRHPVFGVGIGGAGGFRLMVAPGRGTLDLFRGDTLLASKVFSWIPGKWTQVVLDLRENGQGQWTARGKAWQEGGAAPSAWMVSARETNEVSVGRASIWGSPISGTPIRFDDLRVTHDPALR